MRVLLFTILTFTVAYPSFAQTTNGFESKVVFMKLDVNHELINLQRGIQDEVNGQMKNGFRLINSTFGATKQGSPPRQGTYTELLLIFEKQYTIPEDKLIALKAELIKRMDNTAKQQIDSAIVAINTNVLNYLRTIPNEVITQAYKDNLTQQILLDADKKLKELAEALKEEMKK